MSTEAYELLALGMRYWFALLGAVIVLRSFSWLQKDRRARKRALRQLPDAGMVGEIVWLDQNKAFPLPREGVIGAARSCDIRIPARGVRARHALFRFVEGEGVRVTPLGRAQVFQAGEPLPAGAALTHGERVEIGGETLRVRLFAGLNVPRAMAFQPDEEPAPGDALPDAAPPDDTDDGAPAWEESMWDAETLDAPATNPGMPSQETPPPESPVWVAPDGTLWAPVPRPDATPPAPVSDETRPDLYPPEAERGAAPPAQESWYDAPDAPEGDPEPPAAPRARKRRRGRA